MSQTRDLAYEFKQTLTVLKGHVDLLVQERPPRRAEEFERVHHHLLALQEASARATRIVLALSISVFQLVAISDLLENVRVLIPPHAQGQQVTIAITQEPDLAVWGKPGALLHTLLNLATNALESMPVGGTLSFRAREDTGAVVLEIADTGPELPPEMALRILEAIQPLAKTHGGTARMSSLPGDGTTVQIRLPAARAPLPLTLGPLGPRQGPISAPGRPVVRDNGGEVPDGPRGDSEREST